MKTRPYNVKIRQEIVETTQHKKRQGLDKTGELPV
jgi:hypothetical protein